MEVSTVCRNFIDGANRRDWRTAVLNLNGLNMYEMLRSLKALDTADIASLRAALTALGGAVNGPRIEYALSVVVTNTVPATAPGDLEATGQVADARNFRSRPSSILVELIPKARLAGYNATVTSSSNATMQARFGRKNPDTLVFILLHGPREVGPTAARASSNRGPGLLTRAA